MQAGFATLEVGLTRMKHAGAIVAKILVNLAFALATFWAIGFAIAFGDGSDFAGATGWFIEVGNPDGVASLAYSAVDEPTKFFFQATFAAVALAIVWGTMLDRTKVRLLPAVRGRVRRRHLPAHRPLGGAVAGWPSRGTSISPGRASSTSPAPRPRSREPSSSGRASGSTGTAGRRPSRGTRCLLPSSAS